MIYDFSFLPAAFKKWNSLPVVVRDLFRDKLDERLEKPHHKSSKVVGQKGRYLIKLRKIDYQLVYEIHDEKKLIVVISIDKQKPNATKIVTTQPPTKIKGHPRKDEVNASSIL